MRPCIKCGQYRDTIRGVCGYCRGKKTVKDRRKRTAVILVVLIIGSIGGIYGYQTFLASAIAKQMLDEAEEKINQAKNVVEYQIKNIQMPQGITEIIPNVDFETIFEVQQTTPEESKKAIDYINELRTQNSKKTIAWDARVFDLALAWTSNMYEGNYLDHTNPVTGVCPFNMKSNYGLKSNEFVADNGHATMYSGGSIVSYNPNFKSVNDGWMDSRGHRFNLLYDNHVSGAYACTGGACTFMGLNHDRFGEGCSTAKQGNAFWNNVGRQPGEIP